MRVLVTGGAGFLGSHLCDALIAEGHHVLCLDNLISGRRSNLVQFKNEPRFEFHGLDLCDPFDVGRVEFVFHFASPASPVDYAKNGLATLRAGSIGTMNALTYAMKHGAKALFASTSEVYGDPLEHPQKESYWGHSNPIGPRSVYDEAKRFGEAACVAFHRYNQLETQIVRIFNTYGPRLQPNDGRVVSNFMMQALRGQDITVYGDGVQTRSFCYVADLIDGILRMAHSTHPGPMNLGNPREFTMLECAREVLKVTGSKSVIRHEPLPLDDPKQRCPDITLAKKVLGWEPKIQLEEGLRLSLSHFKAALGNGG